MKNSNQNVKRLITAGLLAAMTAVLSQVVLPLPFTPVPVNLATLGVFLAGGILGAAWGSTSMLVYVLLGAVGVPVFAGMKGGLSVLAGPTGGYIIGYVAAAAVIGMLWSRVGSSYVAKSAAMLCGLCVCYAFGTAWFMLSSGKGLIASLGMCVLPFIPGDIIKIAAAAAVAKRVEHLQKKTAA